VEHANSEVVGMHAARAANRFEALEPIRQGVHRCASWLMIWDTVSHKGLLTRARFVY
jgi:hypothetical protein